MMTRGVMRTWFAPAALLALAAMAAGGLSGCMSYRSADPNRTRLMNEARTTQHQPITWPEREENSLKALLDTTPEKTFEMALRGDRKLESAPAIYMASLTVPQRTLVYKGMHAGGVFRVYEEPWTLEAPDPGDRFVRKQLVGSFRSSFTATTEDFRLRQAGVDRYLRWLERDQKRVEEMGNDLGVQRSMSRAEAELQEGVYITLPPPIPQPTRGVIIRLLALGGADYQRELLTPTRNQNWRVVNVGTAGALTGLVGSKTIVNIDTDEELDAAAKEIAQLADDGLAEEAYAVQATMEYIRKERPDLARGPFVIMGFSLGALCTPAVYARLQETMPDAISAVVMIGGGVNLLDIMMRADIPGLELQINWGPGRGGAADRQRLTRRYLDYSKLDPYHTAPLLRQVPVLQMHAELDQIVPADTGEQLYELMGRPDRINFLGGHEPMFYFMASQRDRVRDWLAQSVPLPSWEDARAGKVTVTPGQTAESVARAREAARQFRLRQIDAEIGRAAERKPRVINPRTPNLPNRPAKPELPTGSGNGE